MTQTRNQMRATALNAARYVLRYMDVNPITATVNHAFLALERYAHLHPDMAASQWFFSADPADFAQFRRDWESWQARQSATRSKRQVQDA